MFWDTEIKNLTLSTRWQSSSKSEGWLLNSGAVTELTGCYGKQMDQSLWLCFHDKTLSVNKGTRHSNLTIKSDSLAQQMRWLWLITSLLAKDVTYNGLPASGTALWLFPCRASPSVTGQRGHFLRVSGK